MKLPAKITDSALAVSPRHVLDLQYTPISDESSLGAFKATVKPIQKDKTYLNKSTYILWYLLDKENSEVMAAYCECPGG